VAKSLVWQKVWVAKCLGGKMSVFCKVPKCLGGKMSECQNVAVPKCRAAKMTVADLSTAKMSSAILSVNLAWGVAG